MTLGSRAPFLMRLHSASCRCWAAGRRAVHRSGQTRKPVRVNHPGESAARTMTTHPGSSQGEPMTTTVDLPADSDSLLASRSSELAVRFVNDALPYLDQLYASARRMTRNTVD